MGLFEHWPYTNFHDLNLDWIIKKLPEVFTASAQAVQSAETAVSAKDDAVAAKEAAQSSAENAALSEENAERSAGSAQEYAEHIADPVGGLVTEWLDENIEPTTPPVDSSLTVQGAAADAKVTGDAIAYLTTQIQQSGGMSSEFKAALENLVNHVGYIGDDPTGRTYINALHVAMYPPANLLSISAVYTQSGTVFDTDTLDSLKNDLVVTAYYSDATTEVVTAYTLSGTLTPGTSVITVSYGGKTTTFNVTVTENEIPAIYTAYDYIMYDGSSIAQLTSDSAFETESYSNLFDLSIDLLVKPVTGVLDGSVIIGGRAMTSGSSKSTAFYVNSSYQLAVHTHGSDLGFIHQINGNSVNRVQLITGAASPSQLVINGGEPENIVWVNSDTVTGPLYLFTNPYNTYRQTSPYVQVGEFTLKDSSGVEVGHYYPVLRNADNVIGLYDSVSETFHTCTSAQYATVGNASQRFSVGNWE